MNDEFRELDLGDAPEVSDSKIPSGWDYLSDGGLIRCVFSAAQVVKMGMGANAHKHESLVYWFIEQIDSELFEARRINSKHVPAGDSETIPLHKLVNEFTPQIAYYEDNVLPALEGLADILDQGDEEREDGRLYSAEMEYERARGIEEKNVRALFGLGLIYLTRREVERTRELLAELVQIRAVFAGKNQHLFNEFGIALRKSTLFTEASVYYRRALDFVTDDENLYYNIARVHYEEGDWDGCLENLIMSHRLNPGLGIARDLFEVIVGLGEDENRLRRCGKPPVPQKVLVRARQILAVESGRLSLDDGPVIFGLERGRARTGGKQGPDVGIIEIDDAGSE
jgi:tetratricopeptide (TPR) repeat protein